jgi:hypothetical protein
MNLFIEIENNQIKNHPAFEHNLIRAFGQVPANWEPFIRVERPTPGTYEELDSDIATYQKVNGVWTDVWSLRPMTQAEKEAKQQVVKDAWTAREQAANWATWVFNEDTCQYDPPIPRPAPDETKLSQGIFTVWCGADNNWKDTPVRPQDGKNYKFDFFQWIWVEIV